MELTISRAEILAILPAGMVFITGLMQLFIDLGKSSTDTRSEKTHLAMIGVTGILLGFSALFIQGVESSAETGNPVAGPGASASALERSGASNHHWAYGAKAGITLPPCFEEKEGPKEIHLLI